MKSSHTIFMLVISVLLTSCATSTERLSQINLGMTKAEISQTLGTAYTVRGAIPNKFGQTVEVWEVTLAKPKTTSETVTGATFTVMTLGLAAPVLFMPGQETRFWLYFVDGRLVRWGEAGDWAREADRIYEVRFDTTKTLTQ